MKKFIYIITFFIASTSYAQSGYKFETDILIPHTTVKDQYRSSSCWCFSTLSLIESEVIRTEGDTVNLSERYIVRNLYPVKAEKYIQTKGSSTLSGGSLAHDVMNTIQRCGIIPQKYLGITWHNVNGGQNNRLIKELLNAYISSGDSLWKDTLNTVLDQRYGPLAAPKLIEMGKNYCTENLNFDPEDYVEITSFTHHPLYSRFSLEIPDNFSKDLYFNVSLKEFETIVDSALNTGYSISWDGDVSEKGFRAREGIAVNPLPNSKAYTSEKYLKKPVEEVLPTEEERKKQFLNQSTEDDHLMHIVGIAHDQRGTKYYIIKNSWGNIGPYGGYIYMSHAYFYMKTVAIMLHKEAIPRTIQSKLNLSN